MSHDRQYFNLRTYFDYKKYSLFYVCQIKMFYLQSYYMMKFSIY